MLEVKQTNTYWEWIRVGTSFFSRFRVRRKTDERFEKGQKGRSSTPGNFANLQSRERRQRLWLILIRKYWYRDSRQISVCLKSYRTCKYISKACHPRHLVATEKIQSAFKFTFYSIRRIALWAQKILQSSVLLIRIITDTFMQTRGQPRGCRARANEMHLCRMVPKLRVLQFYVFLIKNTTKYSTIFKGLMVVTQFANFSEKSISGHVNKRKVIKNLEQCA